MRDRYYTFISKFNALLICFLLDRDIYKIKLLSVARHKIKADVMRLESEEFRVRLIKANILRRKSQQDISYIKTYLYNPSNDSWDAFSTIKVLQAIIWKHRHIAVSCSQSKQGEFTRRIVRYLFRYKQTCLSLICRVQLTCITCIHFVIKLLR